MTRSKINLLSLDGGGVRGLSSLIILKRLMDMIDDDDPPKPCEYFDMIAGTSTGGIIAIMLGRLRMTVDECIDCYSDLMDQVFSRVHTKPMKLNLRNSSLETQSRFDTRALEAAIKRVVGQRTGDSNELMMENNPQCKTFVCAMDCQNRKPVRFPTYKRQRGSDPLFRTLRIWEAARATSAASTFFNEITIGMFGQKFRDGGLGANNPIDYLWTEALNEWPDLDERINCVISVGTGQPSVEGFDEESLKGLYKSLSSITTDAEQTEVVFANAHPQLLERKSRRYFRLNVTEGVGSFGLEDTSKSGTIASATNHLFERKEEWQKVEQIVELLKKSRTQPDSAIQSLEQEFERFHVTTLPRTSPQKVAFDLGRDSPSPPAPPIHGPEIAPPVTQQSEQSGLPEQSEQVKLSEESAKVYMSSMPISRAQPAVSRAEVIKSLKESLTEVQEQRDIIDRYLRTLSTTDERIAQAILFSSRLRLADWFHSELPSVRFIQCNKFTGNASPSSYIWSVMLNTLKEKQQSIVLSFACGLSSTNHVRGPLTLVRALVAQFLQIPATNLDFTANFTECLDDYNLSHILRLLNGLLCQCLETEVICLLDRVSTHFWGDCQQELDAIIQVLFQAAEERKEVGAKPLKLLFTCSGPCELITSYLEPEDIVYAASIGSHVSKLERRVVQSRVADIQNLVIKK